MELSSRKQAVLSAIIKAYIETGEPVGSKLLTEFIDNAPSSATLRNEMSELCNLGLLTQPHTSAGRLPTSRGLNLYLSSLMGSPQLSLSARRFIDNSFEQMNCDPELIPAAAGEMLSELTGLPVIVSCMTHGDVRIKKVELVRVSKSSLVLVLITDDGRIRNRVFRMTGGIDRDLYSACKEICLKRLSGMSLHELTPAYLQSVAAFSGINAFSLMPLLTAVFELVEEMGDSVLNLYGESRLFNICRDDETARRIASLVDRKTHIESILYPSSDKVGVIFGKDTGISELQSHILVTSKFGVGTHYEGAIGVIGPYRISYDQVMPSIEYIADKLTDVMTSALKDMED